MIDWDNCLWHGTRGICNKDLNEDGICPTCVKQINKTREKFPKVQDIYDKYHNRMKEVVQAGKDVTNLLIISFLPNDISNWSMTFWQNIIDDIWELNLTPDPNCPNIGSRGGRGGPDTHWASSLSGKGYCGYCYCRATCM